MSTHRTARILESLQPGPFHPLRVRAARAAFVPLLAGLLAASLLLPATAALAEDAASPSPAPTEPPYSTTLPISVDAKSVLVVDLLRGVRLFEKDSSTPVDLPVLNKAVTAYIALDEFPSGTMVTISKVASDEDAGKLGLKTGEKVPLEYLVLGLLLQNSDAAAVALAEQVSGEEKSFLDRMNQLAAELGMADTAFLDASGAPVEGQKTTLDDAAKFFRKALGQSSFARIFQMRDTFYMMPDKTSRHLTSRLDAAWSFVDTLTGGVRSDTDGRASVACTATGKGFSLLCLVADSPNVRVVGDVQKTVEGCFSAYESATLVVAGQRYGESETVDGVTFPIVFNQTVTYVRPIGTDVLADVHYESLGRTSLPVLKTQTVGKAVYALTDGTTIAVDLFPENDVWNPSSPFDQVRRLYETYPDLFSIVLLLLGAMALIVLGRVAELAVKSGRRRSVQRASAGRMRRR